MARSHVRVMVACRCICIPIVLSIERCGHGPTLNQIETILVSLANSLGPQLGPSHLRAGLPDRIHHSSAMAANLAVILQRALPFSAPLKGRSIYDSFRVTRPARVCNG